MKQVKIIKIADYGCYECQEFSVIKDSITDWEEISDDDFIFLSKNLNTLMGLRENHGIRFVMIEKDILPVKERIIALKDILAEERARKEAKAKKAEEKKKAAEKSKKEKAKAKELALLEELKRKYSNV